MKEKSEPLVCSECGQKGNERPGLKLVPPGPGHMAEAAFFDDGAVKLDWIECQNCGHAWPVAAGSVEVRRAS